MSLTALGPDEIAKRLYKNDTVHRAIPSPEKITDADIEQFHRDGFLAVENVFNAEEIKSGIDGIMHLIEEGDPKYIQFEEEGKGKSLSVEERSAYVRKCMWFVQHEARLNALAHNPKLISICERILKDKILLLQDMALIKPPRIGREKPWHQDSAYFAYGPASLLIGTWTALDEATVENGCMHVIPGSQLEGGKAHYHDRDCQLPDDVIEVAKDVCVPLKPGGVLFFSSLLHHGTPPNRSLQTRRALQFHYRSVNAHKLNFDEFNAMFQDSKGVAGCAGYIEGVKVRPMDQRAF